MLQVALGLTGVTCSDEELRVQSRGFWRKYLAVVVFFAALEGAQLGRRESPCFSSSPQPSPLPQGTLWVTAAPSTTVAQRDPPWPDGAAPAQQSRGRRCKAGCPWGSLLQPLAPLLGQVSWERGPGASPTFPF